MKTFFVLGGSYAGFKVRRIAQCGRAWLVRVVGYYPEASEGRSVPEMRILPRDNCTFRFVDLESAKRTFSEWAKNHRTVAEEVQRQKSRTLSAERMRKLSSAGKCPGG